MRVKADAHWRDASRSVKLFIWDGKTAFPLLLLLFYPRLWTLGLTLLAVVFFSLLNHYGFTPMVFFRWVRCVIAGPRKIAIPWWQE